ncbi:MAG: hypothetical protein JO142_21725 [Burkholderiales bacterium]|nr:hypothetical protein [Burkholderiales bacterium]
MLLDLKKPGICRYFHHITFLMVATVGACAFAGNTQTQATPRPDMRGTSLLPLQVEIVQSTAARHQAEYEKRAEAEDKHNAEIAALHEKLDQLKEADSERKLHASEHLADWVNSALMVVFTFALVLIGRRQWKVIEGQLRVTQDQLSVAQGQLTATQAQIELAKDQIKLGQDQLTLARTEFISTSRPRIILRESFTTTPNPGGAIDVTLVLVNNGGTNATIVESQIALVEEDRTFPKRQFGISTQTGAPRRNDFGYSAPIPAGGHVSTTLNCAVGTTWPLWPSHNAISTSAAGQFLVSHGVNMAGPVFKVLYLYGKIAYVDDTGTERHMAFYRVLMSDSWRFVPVDDAQLEYADERP